MPYSSLIDNRRKFLLLSINDEYGIRNSCSLCHVECETLITPGNEDNGATFCGFLCVKNIYKLMVGHCTVLSQAELCSAFIQCSMYCVSCDACSTLKTIY